MATPDITAILASLLSQNATNPYANINTPVIRPPVIPNTPWTGVSGNTPPTTTVWGTPKTIGATTGGATPEDPSGGGRGGTGPGGDTYGKMSSPERDALSKVATGLGILGTVNPGLAALGYSLRGALANDEYGFTSRRGQVGITENDVRDAMDYGGAFAARDKESQRQEQEAKKAADLESFSTPTTSLTGPQETPDSPTDVESGANKAASATPDSPTDTESGANLGGGPGGQDGEGTASGDPGGHGTAGDGTMNAKGGVRKARTATRATFGEAGPETAIFIPEIMKRMGMQGREQEVIRALKTMLQILEGNKRSPISESPTAERKEHANGGRGQ